MEQNLIEARIDLDAIFRNTENLKGLTEKGTRFMAVVKADAYGHGAVPSARSAVRAGADRLGVARLEEALELRRANLDSPILIFGYTPPSSLQTLAENDLTATVYEAASAGALSDAAVNLGKVLRVHLKVDTGMGRVGLLAPGLRPDQGGSASAAEEVMRITELPGLFVEGVYTHFASADSLDKSYTRYQLENFTAFLAELEKKNIRFDCVHAANSAGIIDMPESHFDMVRAGISLYGLYPSSEVDRSRVSLLPAMTLAGKTTSVRRVPKGFRISYGMTWTTSSETCIASVPVGYADGFSRLMSSNGFMLVKGKRAPIAGRVCMDQTIIDIFGIEDVSVGDEVVILGKQGAEEITADEIAERTGTINYEVVSAITGRVPRVYSPSSESSFSG